MNIITHVIDKEGMQLLVPYGIIVLIHKGLTYYEHLYRCV